MKVFVVERKETGWLQDTKLIIVANSPKQAEEIARENSRDFKNEKNIFIKEVDLTDCKILAKINTGA